MLYHFFTCANFLSNPQHQLTSQKTFQQWCCWFYTRLRTIPERQQKSKIHSLSNQHLPYRHKRSPSSLNFSIRLDLRFPIERCSLATNRLRCCNEHHLLRLPVYLGYPRWMEMGLLLHHGLWIWSFGPLHGVSLPEFQCGA